MSRYIDADKLLNPDNIIVMQDETGIDEFLYTYTNAVKVETILNAPTADVVEVVRCRDCKHNVANWQHDELDIGDYTDIVCDYFMTDGMEANDYCSYGERSENENNI